MNEGNVHQRMGKIERYMHGIISLVTFVYGPQAFLELRQ